MDQDEAMGARGGPISSPSHFVPEDSGSGLDISAFNNLVEEIGRESTQQAFSIFFEETTERLTRMQALSCEADRKAIRQDAHGLKGTAANFGFREVSELAARLEQEARTITPVDYTAALRSLATSYAAACWHFARLTG